MLSSLQVLQAVAVRRALVLARGRQQVRLGGIGVMGRRGRGRAAKVLMQGGVWSCAGEALMRRG